MDRVMAETWEAAVALVRAARAIAREAGDQAYEMAESAKALFDATATGGGADDARE
jgi:hypothetical protein